MKPLSVLFVTLAPLLSLVDAVDGAPAAGIGPAAHRRAVGNMGHPSWHRRQEEAAGPPSVITVGAPENPANPENPGATPTDSTSSESVPAATPSDSTTGTTTTTEATTGTTTTTSTDTTTSTSPTTDTASTSSSEGGGFLSSLLSGLLPTDPTTTPTTTETGTPTDPATQPTITDPPVTSDTGGGILDPVTSLIGDLTSDIGGVITDITSGVTLPPTDPPVTDPPVTSEPPVTDPPVTSEPPVTDPPITSEPPITTEPPTTTISTTIPPLDPDGVFPGNNGTQSVTTTVEDPVKPTTLSIDSDYQFISASTFVIAPTTSDTLEVTNTDPDAVQTNPVAASGTTLTMASIPTSIPMFITPPASSDPTAPGSNIPGYTEISILFKSTANWLWVLGSSETAAQILAYMGPLISTALDISGDQVKTVGLKAFVPNDYTEEGDLQTLWLGQIPEDQVSVLSALIHTPNSRFYRSGDGVADSIAANVVMSFNIATEAGVDNSNGSGTASSTGSSSTNHGQRNAIIGVSVAFGVVVLLVTAWWLTKMYKARQEGSHKRLSYRNNTNYGSTAAGGNAAAFAAGAGGVTYGAGGYDRQSRGDPGVRADSPPMLHNPFLTDQEREEQARGIRRNSFYAIGPDDESIEEETFDYLSQRTSTISGGPHGGSVGLNRAGSSSSGGRGGNNWGTGVRPTQGGAVRRPVIGQPISQPILRESSMGNW